MALDYPAHTLIQLSGRLQEVTANDEIWSCGIRAFTGDAGPGGQVPADFDYSTYIAALGPAIQTWWEDAANGMCSRATLDLLKVNNIGSDGKYANPTTTYFYDFATANYGPSSQSVPSYLSLCISWQTAAVRGQAHHGRIYPPNFTYPPTGSAVASGSQAAAAAAGVALLNAINISTGLDGGIMTPAIVSPVGAAWRNITGVRVGNVYDHQERRRNAVPESYYAVPL